MLGFILKKIRDTRMAADCIAWQAGYNYAAGQLIKNGDKAVDHIESKYKQDSHWFDEGMRQAIIDYDITITDRPLTIGEDQLEYVAVCREYPEGVMILNDDHKGLIKHNDRLYLIKDKT